MLRRCALLALVVHLRRSGTLVPPRRTGRLLLRGIGIAALAFLSFVLTVFVATIAGTESSRNHDLPIAFCLVLLALGAALIGPYLLSPARPERTHRARFALVVMWVAGVLVTLLAGADLATNG